MKNQDELLQWQESAENEYQSDIKNPEEIRRECRRSVRHVCNVLGWALTFFTIMTMAVGIFLGVAGDYWADENAIGAFFSKIVNASWYEDGGNTLVVYALVLPFMFLILRIVPAKRAEKEKITFGQFLKFFIIAQGFGTIFNLLGNAVNNAVAAGNGGNTWEMNPVNEMLESISPVLIFYAGFLGPVIEEYIFRFKLLNRLRAFGDKAAITYTALMFGLMHGNLTQFLYATAIGMVLGYVAVKTGRMRYNCLLHILINCCSLILAVMSTHEDALSLVIMFLMVAIIGLTVIGAVIYTIFNIRKLVLSDEILPAGVKFRDICMSMYLNPGTLVFIFVSVVEIAFFLTR